MFGGGVTGRLCPRLLVVAACLGALAHGAPALAAESDRWQAAAALATFPLYRPAVTLGFDLVRVRFQQCGYGNALAAGLYAKGSGSRQPVFAFTEEYPQACGDPGESMTVTAVDVNGARVPVDVFCYSPGPKCTIEDGSENGFLLHLRGSGARPTGITVTSRYVALEDLLTVVRSLSRVSKPRAPPARVAAASGSCSMAEATRVVRRLHLGNADDPDVAKPAAQVLCGAFLGPGSEAMVASLAIPSCGRTGGWVVFRRSGATWQIVMERNNGADLDTAGTGIRETQFVLRPGDAHCFPTGGTRSRTWRWNGARFLSSPWIYSKPRAGTAPQPSASTYGFFQTPSRNILCGYSYGVSRANLGCVVKSGLKPQPLPTRAGCSPPGTVALRPTGRPFVTDETCPGEDAPETPYVGSGIAKVLPYGTTWSGGGLRCTSAETGLTCRNRSGHGFFLSRENWRSF